MHFRSFTSYIINKINNFNFLYQDERYELQICNLKQSCKFIIDCNKLLEYFEYVDGSIHGIHMIELRFHNKYIIYHYHKGKILIDKYITNM